VAKIILIRELGRLKKLKSWENLFEIKKFKIRDVTFAEQ